MASPGLSLECLERILSERMIFFRARVKLKLQSYITNNIPPVIGILNLLLVNDKQDIIYGLNTSISESESTGHPLNLSSMVFQLWFCTIHTHL